MTTNAELQQRKEAVISNGQGVLAPVYVQNAKNAEIWDVEGKRYIDFAAGIAVVNTGHSHPKVVEAVKAQVDNFSHTCAMVSPYESMVELAERLTSLAPISNAKASFVTTGAEAVENAVKIARAHTGRSGVIAFTGAFHGRTNFCMGLTGKVMPYKAGFGPFPGEIFHAHYPIDYHGVSVEESLASLQHIFKSSIEPERVAAIILEPVQGEGGFYAIPEGFLVKLREICDQNGIMLICDEIQTGFARTGKMFATEYHGVEPDLMTMAKGLAGGYPLAAVVGKAEVMDSPNPGGLGGTYAANPVACAASLAVLDIIEEDNLCERAVKIGDNVMARLGEFQAKWPERVGNIRNKGAMIAMEIVNNGDADQPAPETVKAMVGKGAEKGLVLLSCGSRGNVIRLLTPLTIEDEVLNEGLDILAEIMEECM